MNARQIGDLCSLVIAAWAFAMIGIEAGAHHSRRIRARRRWCDEDAAG
jgi:hypothetical protein